MAQRTDPFDVGDPVELELLVRVAGALTDVSSARVFVTPPRDDVEVELVVSHPSLGRYVAAIAPVDNDQPGVWRYRWQTIGPAGVAADHFTIYA